MKKYFLLSLVAIISLTFTSCDSESNEKSIVIDFEDVALNEAGIWNGSDKSGQFTSGNASFLNNYNAEWMSWVGFACSAKTDTITVGYKNQYSSISGNGALKSKKYAVVYQPGTIVVNPSKTSTYKLKSMMVNNSTYAYLDMKNGGDFSKKFVSGDWFKLIITGYKNEVETAKVEFYLADYRAGKNSLINKWTKVDLEKLNEVDQIKFTMESSDSGEWGMNTPAYACIDNIVFEETEITTAKAK